MQLQIEYNNCSLKDQLCYLCKQQFEIKEARVIVCNKHNEGCGEVCPRCIAKGFNWMEKRFQQLSNERNSFVTVEETRLDELVGVLEGIV